MLDQSREFIELATRLNYATAAEHLHLSRSALSRHIADLENELGFALFNRTPLTLTRAGQFYLEAISSIIGEVDRTIEEGRRIAQMANDVLSIYMLPMRTRYADIVYEAAARLRREVPGLSTEVCVDDRFLTTEEALLCGKADVGIVYEDSIADADAIVTIPFTWSPLCAWIHRDNPLSAKTGVTLQDLKGLFHPISLNRQSLTATDPTEHLFSSHGMALKTHLRNIEERAEFYTTQRLDEFVIDFDEDTEPLRLNPDLVKIPFDPPINRPVYLAFLRGSENSIVGKFVRMCRSLAESQGLPQEPENRG